MKLTHEVTSYRKLNKIVPAFNVFGYEDSQAFISAAEKARSPLILMLNSAASKAMPLRSWAKLLQSFQENSSIPLGIHLDHCTDLDFIKQAIDEGFNSVMFDGSKLPLEENLKKTKEISLYAHNNGVLVEAEIGTVPYSDQGETHCLFTSPQEAKEMWEHSGADWLAVSIGNIHRLATKKVNLDLNILQSIQDVCPLPLVIHGASGIEACDIQAIKAMGVGKVNMGTVFRRIFGETLRKTLEDNPQSFDRQELLRPSTIAIEKAAYEIIKTLM